jgi:hypothetical protein
MQIDGSTREELKKVVREVLAEAKAGGENTSPER